MLRSILPLFFSLIAAPLIAQGISVGKTTAPATDPAGKTTVQEIEADAIPMGPLSAPVSQTPKRAIITATATTAGEQSAATEIVGDAYPAHSAPSTPTVEKVALGGAGTVQRPGEVIEVEATAIPHGQSQE